MREDKLETRLPAPLKENAQYALASVVIAVMLYFVGFPIFVIGFLAVLSYFIWRMFLSSSGANVRGIFEFYLVANEIIRDDSRSWYGFEIQEAISRGEMIIRSMPTAPPLVYFGLGALYRKIGDHSSAVKHLSFTFENRSSDEITVVYPSPELREYVKLLRRIERDPTESPLTSAAIRSLERMRRNKGSKLLEYSRCELNDPEVNSEQALPATSGLTEAVASNDQPDSTLVGYRNGSFAEDDVSEIIPGNAITARQSRRVSRSRDRSRSEQHSGRKPITEVLHEIYDGKTP